MIEKNRRKEKRKFFSSIIVLILFISLISCSFVLVHTYESSVYLDAPRGMAISGEYLYVQYASNLTILNISNPLNIVRVGTLNSPEIAGQSGYTRLRATQNYLYSTYNIGFVINNITDPSSVGLVDYYDNNSVGDSSRMVGMDLSDDEEYAFIDGTNDFVVLNITNKSDIVQIAHYQNTTAQLLYGLKVRGNYSFLIDFDNASLRVMDVTDKTNPVQIGYFENYSSLTGANDILVSDDNNTAYILAGNVDAIVSINITDKTSPSQIGFFGNTSSLDNVQRGDISGDTICASAGSKVNSTALIDVSNPTTMFQKAVYTNTSLKSAENCIIEGTYIYVGGIANDSLFVLNFIDSPPSFSSIPANESITYGDYWAGVDFNATDDIGIKSYDVNDSRFTINSSGFLNMTNLMQAQEYLLNITTNDTADNIASAIYNLTINKAIPLASLLNNESWLEVNGTWVNISFSESNDGDGDVSYVVYRDNVSKGSEDVALLEPDNYFYILNTTGGANYSGVANIDNNTLVIKQYYVQWTNPSSWQVSMLESESVYNTWGLKNDGGTNLTNCIPYLNGSLGNYASFSNSSFNFSYGETKNILVTISNPTGGAYNSFLYLACNITSNSTINTTNNPSLIFSVTTAGSSPTPPSGSSSTSSSEEKECNIKVVKPTQKISLWGAVGEKSPEVEFIIENTASGKDSFTFKLSEELEDNCKLKTNKADINGQSTFENWIKCDFTKKGYDGKIEIKSTIKNCDASIRVEAYTSKLGKIISWFNSLITGGEISVFGLMMPGYFLFIVLIFLLLLGLFVIKLLKWK